MKDIQSLLAESYTVTSKKYRKPKERPSKEWLVPANPKHYDVIHAFDNKAEIDWKQGRGIIVGDTVYLYATAPVSAILFKCSVTKTDIPFDYAEKGLTITALMKIKQLKRYKPDEFRFALLKGEYRINSLLRPLLLHHSIRQKYK